MRKWNTVVGILVGVVALISIGVSQTGSIGSQDENHQAIVNRPVDCHGIIALTFDDGPDGSLTPRLLDTLDELDIKATFFVVGSHIEGNEAIIQRMVDEGHSVQAHTWDHPYLTQLEDTEIREQLRQTSMAIVEAGAPAPLYVRPPYGDYDARVIQIVEEEGFQLATWTNDLDTRDWDGPASPEQIVESVRGNLQSGGVVLLHDVLENTVEGAPEIINAIHEEGYCIDLYGDEGTWTLDA